jgi:hypothetical protein
MLRDKAESASCQNHSGFEKPKPISERRRRDTHVFLLWLEADIKTLNHERDEK